MLELKKALIGDVGSHSVHFEAADVANLAMMIADFVEHRQD